MAEIYATPERVEYLAQELQHHDARARVLHDEYAGQFDAGSSSSSVLVGSIEIEVPSNAVIRIVTRDKRPGIEIESDTEPEVPGTWIRVICEAVGECHAIISALESL